MIKIPPPVLRKKDWRTSACVVVPVASALILLQGCASATATCGLVACGVEQEALLQVTAAQLVVPAATLQIYDIRHYPGATVAWRVRHADRVYQCREARNPDDPSQIKFVYCRPQT